MWVYFRRRGDATGRVFLAGFILVNAVMLVTLYNYWGYISRRHTLPLAALLVFFVPAGVDVVAGRLAARTRSDKKRLWHIVLIAFGIGICVPKLVSPVRADKTDLKRAGQWLQEHSETADVIALNDFRISFYADRPGLLIVDGWVPRKASWVAARLDSESQIEDFEGILPKGFHRKASWEQGGVITVVYGRGQTGRAAEGPPVDSESGLH